MKILFAVSNEKITEQVVAKYQIMYNELLSYKEVYYYNAVVKELEKNKDYDAIVIDESLESVSNDKGDQYLLNNLDAITDVAVNKSNMAMPIILICKADRQPAEEFLEKIYRIGIFNALLLKDRKISKICEFIKTPKNKQEAKKYYQINVDDTEVVADTEEDSIAKTELKNILNYYAKLGNDTSKYSETFERIAEQYSDVELVYIIARFPDNVKNVLMNENQKFRSLMNIDPNKLHQMEQERKVQEEIELQKQQVEQNNLNNHFEQENNVEIETDFNQNTVNSNDENQMNIVDIPTDIEEKPEQNIEPIENPKNIDNDINVIKENSNETNVNENIHQVEEIREENNFVPINNINTNNTMNMTPQITNNIFTFVGTSKNRYIIFSKFIRYIIFINRYKYSNS